MLPTVLHVVTAIAAGYAVGSEFSMRSERAWLRAAGGSPLAALVGKLAPLFGIFVLMMVVVAAIIHVAFQIPFRGDAAHHGCGGVSVADRLSRLGALFQLLVRKLALGLSLTAILCSPAFGFAGVGFPLFGMGVFARVWGSLLPLRWYMQILFDQAVRGLPTSASARPFAILAGLAFAYFALAWLRLRAIAKEARKSAAEPLQMAEPASRGVGGSHVRRMAARSRRQWGLQPDHAGPGSLRRALSAALSRPGAARLPIAVVDQDQPRPAGNWFRRSKRTRPSRWPRRRPILR